jgi:hypothetical protein
VAKFYQCGSFYCFRAGFWSDGRQALPYLITEGMFVTREESPQAAVLNLPDGSTDAQVDRHVALKVLPDEFASDAEALGRFQRVAKA